MFARVRALGKVSCMILFEQLQEPPDHPSCWMSVH